MEPGDHLTREEFEKRYDATPGIKKAELIEGIVYMSPPVRWDSHGGPQFELIGWFTHYSWATPGVRGGDNSTLRLDLSNEPQPDTTLFIDPALGGSARIIDGFIEDSPELVAEVSSSTKGFDLNTKLRVYQRNKIREYIVWRVQERAIDWFELRGDKYSRVNPDAEGILKSVVFPGLWLLPSALIDTAHNRILEVLSRGLASPEHAAFVAKLKSHKS